MKFTQETDYAFRVVQNFAQLEPEAYLTAFEMSDKESIPYRFLLRVLGKLKKAGIIQSRQGVDGGYRLAKPAANVTLLDVVTAVEGEVKINRCLKDESLCNAGNAPECRVHRTLAAVQQRLLNDMASYNFTSLEK